MTDEVTTDEGESGAPETPDLPDAPEAAEPDGADTAEPDAPEAAEPDAPLPAVREESPVPATIAAAGPQGDPRAEARRTRLWLPLLLPIGAIAVVAFYTLNVSRVFLAASENDTTPAVIIAAGITIGILAGASVIAAFPDIRTSSLVVGLSGVMLVVLLGGSLVLGASEPEGEASAAYVEPKGPAINTLEVDAFPDLRFQAKRFDVPGGINLIKYIDRGGAHTLLFDGNKVPGFRLSVPTGKNEAKVDLKSGETYTIYCDLPGHRAAGMEADIVVGPKGGAPEPGTQSPTQTTGPGTTQTTVPAGSSSTDGASQSSTGGT